MDANQGSTDSHEPDKSANVGNSAALATTDQPTRGSIRHGNKRPRLRLDGPGIRTAIACLACRERKTRCSGHQPTCTYCLKAKLLCQYTSGAVVQTNQYAPQNFDEWGTRILGAINNLADAQQSLHLKSQTSVTCGNEDDAASFIAAYSGLNEIDSQERPQCLQIICPTSVTSLQCILQWDTFSIEVSSSAISVSSLAEASLQPTASLMSGWESAGCVKSDLLALANIFETRLLPAIPVISMAQIHAYIDYIDEFGIQWNEDSCLVLIVATLASIYHQDPAASLSLSSPSSLPSSLAGPLPHFRILRDTMRYWNMSKKRLGWAIEARGLLGAQCQFLAGIWYLHTCDPVAAWHMFNGSLIVIEDAGPPYVSAGTLTNGLSAGNEKLRERIRTTSLMMVCHLGSEYSFPFSRTSYKLPDEYWNRHRLGQQLSIDDELSFCSLESSLLLSRQQALKDLGHTHQDMSLKDLSRIHATIRAALRRLDEWQSQIPVDLLPSSNDQLDDESSIKAFQRLMLQFRFLEVKELVLRHALYISLHAKVLQNLPTPSPVNELEVILADYMRNRMNEMSKDHREIVYSLLELTENSGLGETLLIAGGWLELQSRLRLGLMLICGSGLQDSPQTFEHACDIRLDILEIFLSSSHMPPIGKLYLELMRKHRRK